MKFINSHLLKKFARFAILIAFTQIALTAAAQNFRGSIHGTVQDPTGALLEKVPVQAIESGTGQVYSTITTSAGEFNFSDLPHGTYSLKVKQNGFQDQTITHITVQSGSVHTLNVKLALATVSSQVNVTAAAFSLDSTNTTQTDVLPTTTTESIPLNGRDFTQLLTVVPGYSGYGVGFLSAVNGAQGTQTNWEIDGTDDNDAWINTSAVNQGGVYGIPGVLLPLDSVDEFSFITQGNSETGHSPGGTVNLALKSGTNKLHGSAYYYNRNEALAAGPVFDTANTGEAIKSKLRDQQYGFTTGGPILRDKTFFFLSYEHQAFDISLPNQVTEPSLAYQTEALAVLNNAGDAYGNYAPVAENPVSANLLNALWPSSALNGPATPLNYYNPGTEDGYSNNVIAKIDHAFNENNHLSLRAFIAQGHQIAPTSSYLSPYFETSPMHVENWALVYDSSITPQLSNQLLVGFNYFNQNFSDADRNFNLTALGLNTGVTSPTLSGAPSIEIGLQDQGGPGFDPVGVTTYSGRIDQTLHFTDAASYSVGKHQLRFGAEIRHTTVDEFYHTGQRGFFSFDGTQGPWAGSSAITDPFVGALADFLAGDVSQSNIVEGDPVRTVQTNGFSLFAHDNFQLTRALNLNYGLRYDFNSPIHDGKEDLSTFVPSRGLIAVGNGISTLYPHNWANLSPHAGFAYQPGSSGSVVIRGSFGIVYDTNAIQSFLGNGNIFNGAPSGAAGNPAGSNPVSTLTLDDFSLPTNGSSIPWQANPITNLFSVSQSFHTPYLYNYNLNLQKSLGGSALAQIGYVGSLGRHLLLLDDLNQAAPGSEINPNDYDQNGANITRPYYSQYPTYGVIDQINSSGTSNYNSLQASLKLSNWHGLVSQFAYTYAHTLDYGSFIALPQNSSDPAAEYGNSDFDQKQNLTAYVLYVLPTHSQILRPLTNGWKLSSLLSFRSGLPFTVSAFSIYGDASLSGDFADRPNLTGNPYAGISHSVQNHQPVQWINPNAFTINIGEFGTMRRNQLYGPGFGDVDLSILKETPIGERVSTEFRIETFNLFNRVNLGNPTFTGANGIIANPGSSNIGIPISFTNGSQFGLPGIGPGEPFNVQLALRIRF